MQFHHDTERRAKGNREKNHMNERTNEIRTQTAARSEIHYYGLPREFIERQASTVQFTLNRAEYNLCLYRAAINFISTIGSCKLLLL